MYLVCWHYFMIKRLDSDDVYNDFIIHLKYRTVRVNEYFTDITFLKLRTAIFYKLTIWLQYDTKKCQKCQNPEPIYT